MKTVTFQLTLLCLMFLSACQSDFGVDVADQELHNYKILFARNTTEPNAAGGTGRSIYVVNADGSGLQDLSQHPQSGYPGVGKGIDSAPQFTPLGKQIAFQSNRAGNQELYVMQSDGSDKKNITNESDLDLEFSWSPDRASLAFTRLIAGKYVLYQVGANGSGLTPITSSSDNSRYPAWSPNGLRLAFSRLIPGTVRWQVRVMNADGSGVQAISDSTESAVFPQWSKDGARVYYMVQQFGLRVKSLDGSFNNSRAGFFPTTLSWSPDGQRFVDADSVSIVTISADLFSVTYVAQQGFDPRFSPDGKWILFLKRNLAGVTELHVARSNGTDERRVLVSQFGDLFASWQP